MRHHRYIRSLKTWVLAVFILMGLGCQRVHQNSQANVIARINDQPLTLREFNVRFKQLKSEQDEISQKNPKIIEELKKRALNETIVISFVEQETKKRNIAVAQEEVEGRLSSWKDGYPPGGFEEMLRKQNTTEAFLKRRIEEQLLLEKLITELFGAETLVSHEEMLAYYKKNRKKFLRPEEIHVFQIVVPTEEEAKKIRKEVRSKGLTFESAARKFSLSPDAANGGDLGFFSKNQKIPEFNEAFKLRVGTISKPIKSRYGFHLLKVVEKRPRKKLKFSEAKNDIANSLRKTKEAKIYQEWMGKLLREGKIYVNEALFNTIS